MGESMKTLPLREMAAMGGLDPKQAAALDKVNLEQVMAIYDPHWRERSQLTMRAMVDQMGTFFTTLEPELRRGLCACVRGQLHARRVAATSTRSSRRRPGRNMPRGT